MNWFNTVRAGRAMRTLPLIPLILLGSACASRPPEINTNVVINFPDPAPITSVEQADQVLSTVTLARSQIDWRYRQKEQICYDRFWMNDCLHEAQKEQRSALNIVKKSEVAANFFKRKKTVEDMDRSLYENNLNRQGNQEQGSSAATPATAATPAAQAPAQPPDNTQ